MLEIRKGNLLEADAEALVNTVNCVGVMGRGIALQFKQAFPDNTKAYERACRAKDLRPGKMLVVRTGVTNPQYVINFPTKTHWKGKSTLAFIRDGLKALVQEVAERRIKTIAIPPLGCGNGGLDWNEVFPLIRDAFSGQSDVRVWVFAPENAPAPDEMPVATKAPQMTRPRALLLKLFEQYLQPGYQLTLLEVQKLAYFLQDSGEPLNLVFVKDKFGPYAEKLNFLLQHIEGHFIRGYGDRSRKAQITLLPGASQKADEFLQGDAIAQERMRTVSQLIEGFENPYGMELLATVAWVLKNETPLMDDLNATIARVHAWNSRKRNFTSQHIEAAWRRLHKPASPGSGPSFRESTRAESCPPIPN